MTVVPTCCGAPMTEQGQSASSKGVFDWFQCSDSTCRKRKPVRVAGR